MDEVNDMKETDTRLPPDGRDRTADPRQRQARNIDPSEAVTFFAFVCGAIGAVVGVVAATVVAGLDNWSSLLVDCLLSAFAGGSAGIVAGGMLGAIIAVARGVTRPTRPEASNTR